MRDSIEELERDVWPEPDSPTGLIRRAHALRKKKLEDLSPDDLRIAFQQQVGTALLKERVVEMLSDEPAAGEVFEGDVILAVISSPQFREDEAFRTAILALAKRALDEDLDPTTRSGIEAKIESSQPVQTRPTSRLV